MCETIPKFNSKVCNVLINFLDVLEYFISLIVDIPSPSNIPCKKLIITL
jgi:hypothetical protein